MNQWLGTLLDVGGFQRHCAAHNRGMHAQPEAVGLNEE